MRPWIDAIRMSGREASAPLGSLPVPMDDNSGHDRERSRAACYRTLMIVALSCLCMPANAQDSCSELARLRAEGDTALKKAAQLTGPERCYAYVHYSVAWSDIK